MMEMVDPHDGMISFQEWLTRGALAIDPVQGFQDLYSHMDMPTPGTARLTYVRLTSDRQWVTAFLSCVMNGYVDDSPCVALGYATPDELRNKGHAQSILKDVMSDQIIQAKRAGHKNVYFEAVVDVTNPASQRVASAVLGGTPENIVDQYSGRPAQRYTACFDTTSGRRV